jgi:hypothetical protein
MKQDRLCNSCRARSRYSYNLFEDDPQAVDYLIQYFYYQDYQRSSQGSTKTHTKLVDEEKADLKSSLQQSIVDDCYPIPHVRLYALAELHGTLALKLLALKKFNKTIHDNSQPNRSLDSVEEAYALMIPDD